MTESSHEGLSYTSSPGLAVDELEARVAAGEKATGDAFEALAREITELKTQLAQLLEQDRTRIPQRWATYATEEDWSTLVLWVDELHASGSLQTRWRIPNCWPAHPGVVEELAALWLSWKAAAITAQTKRRGGTAEYTAWHDRWLWPTLRRLQTAHYAIANCSESHVAERPAGAPTDRTLIPPVTAGPSATEA